MVRKMVHRQYMIFSLCTYVSSLSFFAQVTTSEYNNSITLFMIPNDHATIMTESVCTHVSWI
jgi:hypothetical protein